MLMHWNLTLTKYEPAIPTPKRRCFLALFGVFPTLRFLVQRQFTARVVRRLRWRNWLHSCKIESIGLVFEKRIQHKVTQIVDNEHWRKVSSESLKLSRWIIVVSNVVMDTKSVGCKGWSGVLRACVWLQETSTHRWCKWLSFWRRSRRVDTNHRMQQRQIQQQFQHQLRQQLRVVRPRCKSKSSPSWTSRLKSSLIIDPYLSIIITTRLYHF